MLPPLVAVLICEKLDTDVMEKIEKNDRGVRFSGDIPGSQEQGAIENAMDTWSAVTKIDFLEACNAADADIRISWETWNHGDFFNFDGNNCVNSHPNFLAHAAWPSPFMGDLAGDIHFDNDELWTLNGDEDCDNIDLETVALHELGHSLGLEHSNVNFRHL